MKLLITVFLISSSIFSISAQNSAKCDPQDSLLGNKCYRFVDRLMNFTSAIDYCRGIGYSLTSIHSMFENNFLTQQAENIFGKTHHDFYIGLYSPSKNKNNWAFVDGSAYDFNNWHSGEPTGTHWYAAFRVDDGKWITVSNSASIPFVCSAASNNTSPANTTMVPMTATSSGSVPMTTTSSGTVCPNCTQVITDETYWRGPEPANLCIGTVNMNDVLAGIHGPPTITPIPNSVPYSETIACDPARYNSFLIIYSSGDAFSCGKQTADFLNNNANPFQYDAANSGLFLDSYNNPTKAILCYNNGA